MAQKIKEGKKTRTDGDVFKHFAKLPPTSREEIIADFVKGLRKASFAKGDLAKVREVRRWKAFLEEVRKIRLLPEDADVAEIEAEIEVMSFEEMKDAIAASLGVTRAVFEEKVMLTNVISTSSDTPSGIKKVKEDLTRLRRIHHRLLGQDR